MRRAFDSAICNRLHFGEDIIRFNIIDYLLEQGYDPNEGLMGAMRCGNFKAIDYLIERGATHLNEPNNELGAYFPGAVRYVSSKIKI